MWLIAILAVLALGADLTAHIAAIAGSNPMDWFHPLWAVVVLFWAALVLMIVIANAVDSRRRRLAKMQGIIMPADSNPRWFKWISYTVAAYALLNAIFYGVLRGHPGQVVQQKPGVYVIDPGHGVPLETITEAQYRQYRRNEVRGASGFVLIFYVQIAVQMVCLALGLDWEDPRPPRQTPTRWTFVVWTRSQFKSR